MNKGLLLLTLTIILATSACKRRHICYCKISGTSDTSQVRELRGYSVKEARTVCKSLENASNNALSITCDIN